MWVLKFDIRVPEDVISHIANKTNTVVHIYLIKHYMKNNKFFFFMSGFIEGDNKAFYRELKKSRWVKHLEVMREHFIVITYRPLEKIKDIKQSILFEPSVIYIKPAVVYPSGLVEMTLGSWEKTNLSRFIRICKKHYHVKMKSLKRKKTTTVGILTSMPSLTEKQQHALDTAVKQGYYEYPRKTELKELAEKTGVSFSTYKAHLRKAERKMMPFLIASVK